ADYAAANAVLDAIMRAGRVNADRLLSINWPAWREVGMAVATLADERAQRDRARGIRHWQATISAPHCPVLDEHRINRIPVLPGTAYLDFLVRAFGTEVNDGQAVPVRLTDVAFQRPLAVPHPRRLQILFEPDGMEWVFTVRSTPESGAEPADGPVHVTGRI